MKRSDAGRQLSQPPDSGADPAARVADRYRLLERLGRGGSASVYRAHDERRDRPVALKLLHPDAGGEGEGHRAVVAAFEHEFQVLSQLSHPRVVRVFEYGHGESAPYYTMELLEGCSLRSRLPLPAGELCAVLRDVASCLALLHARRYVHRDVTPRNVWCEHDGRAKLLDFGTMAALGESTRLMGTPPFVSPEAFYGEPLDGRADLFALGALAYRALSGRDAFPARRFRELPALWQQGPAPLPHDDDVPAALGELVMELLSLDPAGRPGTAAETIERLCAIGGIATDPVADASDAQAYLVTPPLLGREAALHAARRSLRRTRSGRGACLMIRGAPGMGHTRMLRHLAREATALGMVALHAEGRGGDEGDQHLLRSLCEQALEKLPDDAIGLAAEHAPLLAALGPLTPETIDGERPSQPPALASSSRVTAAVHDWLTAVTAQQPLLISVDGLQRCDPLARALVQRLAHSSGHHALLVAVGVAGNDDARTASLPLAFAPHAEEVELEALTAGDVEALTDALFWGAPQRGAVARWLHRVSEGVPRTCVTLAQHLLDAGLARYEAGRWHLPEYPDRHGLPTDLQGVLQRRVDALRPAARELAHALSLAYDDTRPDYQPKLLLGVAELATLLGARHGEVHRALGELHAAGVVREVDGHAVIAHRALAELLRARASDEQARRVHAGLGEVLSRRPGEKLTAARHLQLAGRDAEALELITGERGAGVPTVDAMRLSLAADCYTHALRHARRQDLPRRTLADLRGSLVMVAAVFDWSLSEHARDEMRRLSREVGLDHLEALHGGLSAKTTLELCMEQAAQAHGGATEDERLAPAQALSRLGRFGSALSLSLSGAHDVDGLRELVELLRQARGDSELTAVRYEAAQQLLEIIEGREMSRLPLSILGRYGSAPGLNAAARTAAMGVHAHAVGVWLAERGDAAASGLADSIEQVVPGIWIAAHVHWLAAGFACDGGAMARWETRAMAVAPDDLWRRRGFLRVEARLHALTGDLLSLGAVLPEMDLLAERFEGWRPLRDWAWGEHHLIRGDLDEAEAHLQRAVQATGPGEHVAYGYAHAAWVAAQVLRGDARGAVVAAEEGLQQARSLGLSPVARLDWLLSLAEARTQLGELDQADATLQRAARLLDKARLGGIHAGRVAEARARCAMRRGEPQAAQEHLRALEPSFRDGSIPQLMSRYVRLQHEVQRGEGGRASGGDLRWTPVSETRELRDRVQEVLTGEGDPVTRTREALTLLGDTDDVPTRRR